LISENILNSLFETFGINLTHIVETTVHAEDGIEAVKSALPCLNRSAEAYLVARNFSAQSAYQLCLTDMKSFENLTIDERDHLVHHLIPWFLEFRDVIVFLRLV